ncbi:hypothetical protein ACFR99_07450 [Haloarchaeobius amylolyticus]|uniref:Uncharacterized protein n=1 Tax=Haloarchaeobius amylolyticus TaxID=1198296 RepID=A0ABD6BF90_9EURY
MREQRDRTMIGLESLGATGQAITGVGAVLVEAMVLYVVYGALTTALSGPLKRVLGGT